MLHLVRPSRRYDPDIIAVMTTAFDQVPRCLSARMNDNERCKARAGDGNPLAVCGRTWRLVHWPSFCLGFWGGPDVVNRR